MTELLDSPSNPGKASDHILALTGHVVVPAASDL